MGRQGGRGQVSRRHKGWIETDDYYRTDGTELRWSSSAGGGVAVGRGLQGGVLAERLQQCAQKNRSSRRLNPCCTGRRARGMLNRKAAGGMAAVIVDERRAVPSMRTQAD